MDAVTIYTQDGCHKCDALKKRLKEHHVPFVEEKDVKLMISLGFTETPMLKAGQRIMNYDQAIEFLKL